MCLCYNVEVYLDVLEAVRQNCLLARPTAQMLMLPSAKLVVRPTTVVEAPRLEKLLGTNIVFVSEAFQYTGSFKFRAAGNVATTVPHKMLITASSGNFGQALAFACSLVDKSCIVVMPNTSAQIKIEAVRKFGGQVEFVDVRTKSRQERVAELALKYPAAYIASAYDDPLVIAGNASLGREIAALDYPFDGIVVPIGGGGLASGLVQGVTESRDGIEIIGAEPMLGNDAARSLAAGEIMRNATEPQTIADGARTISLGQHNWAILRRGLSDIIEVSEDKIIEAVRLLFLLANVKAEPTGALALGAVLSMRERFRDRCLCCIVSGGNVDPNVFANIINRSSTDPVASSIRSS